MSKAPLTPQAIASEFRTRLAASLEMLCGERVDVVEGSAASAEALIWRRFSFDAESRSALYVAAPEIIGRALGASVLSAAGLDDFSDDDVVGSYCEVLQSAVSAVAQFVGRIVGTDLTIDGVTEAAPDAPLALEVSYQLKFRDQTFAPVRFGVAAGLIARFGSAQKPSEAETSPETESTARASEETASSESPSGRNDDLSRILDLELPVRVSFGKAQVSLKDVLKLTTGSIVELDRSIHDPVEIIVNDRVVGRGEVVVIEGNYGVRIQEIVSLGAG